MANSPTNIKQREDHRGPGTAGQFPQETRTHGLDSGSGTTDRIKDTVSEAGDKAKDIASSVANRAKEMAAYAEGKVDQATSAVGSGMQSLAGGVERASSAVVQKLDSGGRYLQEHNLRGITEDVGNLIRRNPWPALLVGVGVGFLLARAVSRS